MRRLFVQDLVFSTSFQRYPSTIRASLIQGPKRLMLEQAARLITRCGLRLFLLPLTLTPSYPFPAVARPCGSVFAPVHVDPECPAMRLDYLGYRRNCASEDHVQWHKCLIHGSGRLFGSGTPSPSSPSPLPLPFTYPRHLTYRFHGRLVLHLRSSGLVRPVISRMWKGCDATC